MLAQVDSVAIVGMSGIPVLVEVHIGPGLPGTTFVGLPDAAVREAKDRVRAALLSAGLEWPNRRITVNLAPVGVPKPGSSFDLPIALGIQVASGRISPDRLAGSWVVGEVGLDGSVRPVGGVLAAARRARETGRVLICPAANACEAALLPRARVVGADNLGSLVETLATGAKLKEVQGRPIEPIEPRRESSDPGIGDLAEVRGQARACTALEVALAGGLNLLMFGPPGTGKTMIARRAEGIQPPLDLDEALEVGLLHSLARGGSALEAARSRPFRAPHHTASAAALVGGGAGIPLPGEVSLAHRGVLLLDELSLFSQAALDALRQPLEDGEVHISRSRASVSYPARPVVVATANPCPCGFARSGTRGGPAEAECRCGTGSIRSYQKRLSGPLVDRFDLVVRVSRPNPSDRRVFDTSQVVAARVAAARHLQVERLGPGRLAGSVSGAELDSIAPLTGGGARALAAWASANGWSLRRVRRAHRVSWVLGLLEGRSSPTEDDVNKAVRMTDALPGPAQ